MESKVGESRAGGSLAPPRKGGGAIRPGPTAAGPKQILSPGPSGSVFNPVVWAEFRRWRARPITYSLMTLLTVLAVGYLYAAQRDLLAGAASRWEQYLHILVRLVIRPSTIVPVMMVWRALVSFRDGSFYEPFRTTFLTPGQFLWGIVAVPFFVSAVILVGYTGIALAPGVLESYFAITPERRTLAYFAVLPGILYEGSLNGILICFIALYFGLRGGAYLDSLMLVILFILGLEALQGIGHLNHYQLREYIPEVDHEFLQRTFEGLWMYVLMGTPKLILSVLFWSLAVRVVHTREPG
jgi:hypothetical protein